MTIDQIAQTTYETLRAYEETLGETVPAWADVADKGPFTETVNFHLQCIGNGNPASVAQAHAHSGSTVPFESLDNIEVMAYKLTISTVGTLVS